MLVLLIALLYSVANGGSYVASLPIHIRDSASSEMLQCAQCSCSDGNMRSRWDVVWSCLATIFACTWVAVHPNIPAPEAKDRQVIRTRLELMGWSIIAPEIITYWATRQWVGARKLAKKYKERGWTKTHGYFIQMGGFMLYEGNTMRGILSPEHLEELLEKEEIEFPNITEEEIKDRSKGDALSKTLVLGQTGWFIAQCISRRAQDLGTTQLELVTLAFSVLNGFMYYFWWNKPLDVRTSVPVQLLSKGSCEIAVEPPVVHELEEADIHETTAIDPETNAARGPEVNTSAETNTNAAPESTINAAPERDVPSASELTAAPATNVHATPGDLIVPPKTNAVTMNVDVVKGLDHAKETTTAPAWSPLRFLSDIFYNWPVVPIFTPFREFDTNDRTTVFRNNFVKKGELQVPTLYAYEIAGSEDRQAAAAVSLIGIVFGAIHCIGWNFVFPSKAEKIIWRAGALVVTFFPCQMVTLDAIGEIYRRPERLLGQIFDFFVNIAWVGGMYVGVPLYVLARFTLVMIALISLRDLSPQALESVQWTSFLPHI